MLCHEVRREKSVSVVGTSLVGLDVRWPSLGLCAVLRSTLASFSIVCSGCPLSYVVARPSGSPRGDQQMAHGHLTRLVLLRIECIADICGTSIAHDEVQRARKDKRSVVVSRMCSSRSSSHCSAVFSLGTRGTHGTDSFGFTLLRLSRDFFVRGAKMTRRTGLRSAKR